MASIEQWESDAYVYVPSIHLAKMGSDFSVSSKLEDTEAAASLGVAVNVFFR